MRLRSAERMRAFVCELQSLATRLLYLGENANTVTALQAGYKIEINEYTVSESPAFDSFAAKVANT